MESQNKFISIFPDLAFQIYKNSIPEFDRPILFVARYVTKMISFKPDRYTYHIYDNDKKLCELQFDGWRVESQSIEHYYYRADRLEFIVVDPSGKSRSQRLHLPISIEAVIELYKHLKQFSGFMNWSHYDLYPENKKLRTELQTLKEKYES